MMDRQPAHQPHDADGRNLVAARMTKGGLSLWQALALMRQAFVPAFLPSAEREALLQWVDSEVCKDVKIQSKCHLSINVEIS